VVYKIFAPDNHHVKVRCKIAVTKNITLKPGSLVITKRHTVEEGVHLEKTLTKMLRRNIFFKLGAHIRWMCLSYRS
jgi:hypothetical protein